MLRKLVIHFPFLFFCFILDAQTYHFTRYGVKDGLAQSNVSGIVQDSSGFYWIATEGGISRFDGRNFVNYTTEDGLADNNVSAVFLDSRKVIWLGHENGQLSRFDGSAFKPISSSLLPKDKKIYGFFEDSEKGLWVCTATGGAFRILDPARHPDDKFKLHIKMYSGREGLSQYVFSAAEDKNGNIWFLTDIGVKIYYKTTRRFEFFRTNGMPPGQISCIAPDRQKNMLIGTTAGTVVRYDIASGAFEPLIAGIQVPGMVAPGPALIYALLEDSQGNVWASGSNLGVFRYSRKSGKVTAFNTTNGLAVNKIKSIYEDREGNILLGTAGEGVEVFSSERFISFNKKNGLADNQVWSVCKDADGRMWFGTNEGLTVYDASAPAEKACRNLTVKEGLRSNNIRALVRDQRGDLWIGSWGGKVLKYDMQRWAIVQVPALDEIVNQLVSCLFIDKRNQLWIGTIEGIVKYDPSANSVSTMRTIDGLSDNDISCIFEDSRGRIWIGTRQKGVNVLENGKIRKYNRENGLNYGSVSSIAEDQQHNIWIGTEGGGAFVFNGREFRNYKARTGLVSDLITAITVDRQGHIWLGSNKGLNRFDPAAKTFRAYLSGDGFTGLETKPRAVFADNNGDLWFGTVNGAFRYRPENDRLLKRPPVAQLLQFRVNLEEMPVRPQTTLPYNNNSLNFDFVGISVANPEAVTYRVKLEGYDNDWRPGSRQGSEVYSNLPHGKYVFSFVACNASGVCSEPFSMRIVITPPYWKTWWFYLAVAAAGSGILFAYIKLRERKLRQEKKILEDKVSERTAEVLEKNKELDEINKDITASIRYAKRIQDAILPPDEFVKKHLPDTFILFKPKDIVSGDFYWMEQKNGTVVFAAVDCTGHGVPGAFMSIVGHNLLDRVVGEQNITQPARILDELNKSLAETLRQRDLEDNTVRDGMDIALCSLDRAGAMLEYAGAYNPLWLIRDKDLTEIKADKFPIGNSRSGDTKRFTNHSIPLQKGDTLYIFSDGFADQFGGPLGKKFKSNAFKQLLISSQHLDMAQQRELLDRTIEQWRGNHEQVDDILVIGTRYH